MSWGITRRGLAVRISVRSEVTLSCRLADLVTAPVRHSLDVKQRQNNGWLTITFLGSFFISSLSEDKALHSEIWDLCDQYSDATISVKPLDVDNYEYVLEAFPSGPDDDVDFTNPFRLVFSFYLSLQIADYTTRQPTWNGQVAWFLQREMSIKKLVT